MGVESRDIRWLSPLKTVTCVINLGLMTIILVGEPKSANHIYKFARRGTHSCMFMTDEGKALKEVYQWEARGEFHGKPHSGPLTARCPLRPANRQKLPIC